jgi:capsular polysaccharide biosynthesis protein
VNEPVELNLRDLLDFIRRGLVWAVVVAGIAAAGAYYWSSGIPPTYSTRATLVATHQDPGARSFGTILLTAPALDAAAYRTAISSRAVLEPAANLLVFAEGGQTVPAGRLAGAVSVSTEGTSSTTIIRITARAGDPALAAAMANSVAQAAVQWDEGRATRSLDDPVAAGTTGRHPLRDLVLRVPLGLLPQLRCTRAEAAGVRSTGASSSLRRLP